MKKRKFGKVYFVCQDNRVFGPGKGYSFVKAYSTEAHARHQETHQQADHDVASNYEWNKSASRVIHKAHGFFLVHESLYDEIIKPFDIDASDQKNNSK